MSHAKTAAAERLHRRRLSRAARRRWRDPAFRARSIASIRAGAQSLETRRRRAEVARAGWADPAERRRRLEQLARARARAPYPDRLSVLARRIARAARLPSHVAYVVASVAMGVMPS